MAASNVTVPKIRCSISLNEDQKEIVVEYLTRSTCFWNFLMYHLKTEINEYIESKGNLDAYATLLDRADSYLDLLNYPTSEKESEIEIEAAWKEFIPQMRELPFDSLRCRLRDLIEALTSYMDPESGGNAQRPKTKTERSAQAISFSRNSFKINDASLTIEGFLPIEIDVPELIRVPFEVKEILIGKKANLLFEKDSKLGPVGQESVFFLIASS